jgi:hypothetical protein
LHGEARAAEAGEDLGERGRVGDVDAETAEAFGEGFLAGVVDAVDGAA